MAFTCLQIEMAPEPSTFALMAIGLGGLVFLARSRRGLFAFRG